MAQGASFSLPDGVGSSPRYFRALCASGPNRLSVMPPSLCVCEDTNFLGRSVNRDKPPLG